MEPEMNVWQLPLQEAGATPTQELAYSLATAIGVLDAVRESGQVDDDGFAAVFASISFFVNAGIRFVEETCKMRAFSASSGTASGSRSATASPIPRRAGSANMRVNSLGLTRGAALRTTKRIVLETLGVTLSRDARARSIQLLRNEALGLLRPWDQQWALRIQQGKVRTSRTRSKVPDPVRRLPRDEGLTDELVDLRAELEDAGYWRKWGSRRSRSSRAASSPRTPSACAPRSRVTFAVVGVNKFVDALPSPLEARLHPPGRSGRWRPRPWPSCSSAKAARPPTP